MKTTPLTMVCLFALLVVPAQAQMDETATPRPLVDAYDSLADTLLAAKKTEWNLVHSILGGTYSHAEGVAKAAMAKLDAGQNARAELENLAELVAQIGNEGDSSVAAIRKRLLEGGHHHHAQADDAKLYDDGFVIVTRASKKAFLDAAGRIGRLAAAPDKSALEKEWGVVRKEFKKLHAGTPVGH